jgi:type II secretory pathway pseudopilin PulG
MKFLINFQKKGATLIELLLYMGLMAIFLTVISQIFITSLSNQLEAESISSLEQDGRFILARFGYDIGRASSVVTPSSPGEAKTMLKLLIDSDEYVYSLSGNNLVLTNALGADQLNSVNTTVSNLQIVTLGNTGGKFSIRVSFKLTSVFQREKGRETKTFTMVFGTR